MAINTSTNIDYLIPSLRLQLGDIDATSYRYMDEWLRQALINAVINLQSWWGSRYIVDITEVGTDPSNYTYEVQRNPDASFDYDSPPLIQQKDERPIILMASIIIKEGSLEAASWNTASWKDAEISYSNIEGGRMKDRSLARDWDELLDLLKPPQKQLAKSYKGRLPGYIKNRYDRPPGSL